MLQKSYPLLPRQRGGAANTDLEVTDKFTGEVATRVAHGRRERRSTRAIAAAVDASRPMARDAAYERQAVLEHCVDALSRALRRTRACAVHRGRQADQGLAKARSRA